MATLDVTAFNNLLKILYPDWKILDLVYQDNPLLALLPKSTNFVGKSAEVPVIYGTQPARSASFSTAKTNRDYSKNVSFSLTRVKDYAVAAIDNETIQASKSSDGGLVPAIEREMDAALEALKRSMGIAVFGNGSGKVGSVGNTSFATTVMTLENAEDVTNFEVGQRVVLAADESSALRDSGAVGTITAVDRDAGTLTFGSNLSTIWPSIATGDAIFCEGDYTSAGDRNKLSGLDAWIPATAPTSGDNFFGVDRSVDVTRLAGIRMSSSDYPGLTVKEAFLKLATRIGREGGRPDVGLCSYGRFEDLVNSLDAKTEFTKRVGIYEGKKLQAEVSYSGVRIHGPRGPIDVIPDQNCPHDSIYVLTSRVWRLRSLGPAPQVISDLATGRRIRTDDSIDAVEIRVGYYANIECRAPGWNGRFDF